ncbi:MAG: hypothetical protein HQL89_04835 [Magnetococcales bacterium]|nr:hypothetical protein [Magnetococcales bacterium]
MVRTFVRIIVIALPFVLWSCQTKGPGTGTVQPASPTTTQTPVKPTSGEEKKEGEAKASGSKGKSLIGISMEELQRTLGPPESTIDSTISGRSPSEAWIYPSRGNSTCVDTYVVGEESKKVEDYFCR